jgi:hypothetical protein
MTEAELNGWGRLARRRGLPWQRIELLLAQLTLVVAKTMGGAKNVRVDDFMLKEPEVLPDNVTHIDIARKAFGFNPRRRKA